ncbi:hypothetical protein FHS29_007337 [Saccharothrix tamanrassetensis]|uniref:Uncharacterized protein n=1 Tax=Saccharothrix tamanrassetensis TaxID=1051531 RepID=A0A841CTS6_9PSEU|nr:hypothetical protein [Saccharothrix tamanrassetensis]
MGGGVDTSGQAGHDGHAAVDQFAGHATGALDAFLAGLPGADHGDTAQVVLGQFTAHEQKRRRVVHQAQDRR